MRDNIPKEDEIEEAYQISGLKVAVVTLALGGEAINTLKLTCPRMEAYAKRIGADFRIISRQTILSSLGTPMFEKAQIQRLLASEYDRVIYVDADMLISDNCPDLFELVPPTHVGVTLESDYIDHAIVIKSVQCELGNIGWDKIYFNAGLMVISKQHRHMFNLPCPSYIKYGDQTQLNYNIQQLNIPLYPLSGKFNYQFRNKRMTESFKRIDGLTSDNRFDAHILHYSDNPKGDVRIAEIKRDVAYISGTDKEVRII